MKNELIKNLQNAIANVKTRMDKETGYVVANDDYINVEEGYGLNGLDYAPFSIFSAEHAVVYPTADDAYRFGQDFYLRNGNGEEIILKEVSATEYFDKAIKLAEDLINTLNKVA